MGGRGSYANGQPKTYKTVGKIHGVKVLEGITPGKDKGLPVESYTGKAYIQLHKDGTFKMYREYDNNHKLFLEIAYHREPKLSSSSKPILHVHEYNANLARSVARLLTEAEYKKYKKYFKGV